MGRVAGADEAATLTAEGSAAFYEAAGRWLAERRTLRGWNQEQLAERAGVTNGTISAYEAGTKRHPGLTEWWRLCAALGSSLDAMGREIAEREGATLLTGVRTGDDAQHQVIDHLRLRHTALQRAFDRQANQLATLAASVAALERQVAALAARPGDAPQPAPGEAPRTPADEWEPTR